MPPFVVVFLALSLVGQAADSDAALARLRLSLMTLSKSNASNASGREKLTAEIMVASEEQHRPSVSTVGLLANEIVSALAGRHLSDPQFSELAAGIIGVLYSAGVGTHTFSQSVALVEKVLVSGGVRAEAAQKVAATLTAIGKEVRGPEGVPASALK